MTNTSPFGKYCLGICIAVCHPSRDQPRFFKPLLPSSKPNGTRQEALSFAFFCTVCLTYFHPTIGPGWTGSFLPNRTDSDELQARAVLTSLFDTCHIACKDAPLIPAAGQVSKSSSPPALQTLAEIGPANTTMVSDPNACLSIKLRELARSRGPTSRVYRAGKETCSGATSHSRAAKAR